MMIVLEREGPDVADLAPLVLRRVGPPHPQAGKCSGRSLLMMFQGCESLIRGPVVAARSLARAQVLIGGVYQK